MLYHLFYFTFMVKQWIARRFTSSGLALFTCLIISAIVGVDTKQTVAYQIFTFLVAITAIAMLSSIYSPKTFSVNRHLPKYGSVGQPIRYSVTVFNPSNKSQKGLKILEDIRIPIPKWDEVKQVRQAYRKQRKRLRAASIYYRYIVSIFQNNPAHSQNVELPDLPARSHINVVMKILPKRRGILRLSGVKVLRSDPFGLFNALNTITLPQSILVLPKRYELPSIDLPGSRRHQPGGISLSSSVSDSTEFLSLREYRQGDSLRKIHWKSWARTGKPVVREEQDEFFVRHALILDTFQSERYSPELEEAVSIAASFACTVKTEESLLDLMFVGLQAYCFTSGRGLDSTERFLEILASVSACQDKSFDRLTDSVLTKASQLSGCICIFIAWDDRRKTLVRKLQQMGVPNRVLVIRAGDTVAEERDSNLPDIYWLEVGKIQEGLMQL